MIALEQPGTYTFKYGDPGLFNGGVQDADREGLLDALIGLDYKSVTIRSNHGAHSPPGLSTSGQTG